MTMPQRLGATLVVVLALLGLTAGTSAAQQVPTVGVSIPPAGPPQTDILSAGLWSALHAEASPPGANDYTCTPGPGHPNPVVLVHGTFGNAYDSWSELSPELKADGYCVFALNYGGAPGFPFQGYGDIATSAAQLQTFVDMVLAATHASSADMVGHSQGGLMPRYYIQNLGGASRVHQLIGLASSNYGTDFFGILPKLMATPFGAQVLNTYCPACVQQATGSAFLNQLNANGDTVTGVQYTVIETRYDEVVTPYTNALMKGAGAKNITVQDVCSQDFIDHIGIPYDPITLRLVRNELDPTHAVPPPCVFVPPVIG
jgi:triacylglycerol esterase/lipase EstA (alpha/beta hydrolase family)